MIILYKIKGRDKMIKLYRTNEQTNELQAVEDLKRGTWINLVNPSEKEIKEICEKINIDDQFIRYSLDYEEKARIDVEDDTTLFIIDIPVIEKNNDGDLFSTMPIGLITVRDDYFLTVSLKSIKIIEEFEKGKTKGFFTFKKTRFLLQIFFKNASYYLSYLKRINKETETAEHALQKSMKNKELIKLLGFEKSLVYFRTSLASNELVMEKTLNGRVIKLYDDDQDILEDAIVENKQAMEMTKIYSDILSGTMDAYASIISNNLNIVMKFLTTITIVLSVPTIVSSFFGMNVGIPFENHPNAFFIVICITIGLSAMVAWWFKKREMF
jgi:magnesium transporter